MEPEGEGGRVPEGRVVGTEGLLLCGGRGEGVAGERIGDIGPQTRS